MIITDDHWLADIRRDELPGGNPMLTRRFLVIHFTSGASGQSSIDFWRSPAAMGACAHIVIERDGTVIQCRPFDKTCGHTGVSAWHGFKMLNSCAIGIELANAGDDVKLAKRYTHLPLVHAKHKHESEAKDWEAYPPAQIEACQRLAQVLVQRYHLDDVIGHDDCAPDRKNDPGPAFPMEALREACGFTGLPKP